MLKTFEANRYTGTRPWPLYPAPMMAPGPLPAGHCRRCGAPSGDCRCGCRECRREAKELLVEPTAQTGQAGTTEAYQPKDAATKQAVNRLHAVAADTTAAAVEAGAAVGLGTAFIGGGCCTSLSVEYAPSSSTVPFVVGIIVTDSEGTTMIWARQETAGTPYRVKECVITTKPGARLEVVTLNCTARVRWCEIFSCGC